MRTSDDSVASDDPGVQRCPYCGSTSECAHLLLLVDNTFRTAEGGLLMEAFNERWAVLCEEGGEDFDEREPFENLLEDVDAIADWSMDYDQDGGPGLSSDCSIYYVASSDHANQALTRFKAGG